MEQHAAGERHGRSGSTRLYAQKYTLDVEQLNQGRLDFLSEILIAVVAFVAELQKLVSQGGGNGVGLIVESDTLPVESSAVAHGPMAEAAGPVVLPRIPDINAFV